MKLSFVVPIYNVKDYLQKCMDSLVAQNYEDYEIILVDDGSTDGSGELADAIKDDLVKVKEKEFISVIHQKNKGLSGARNSGIKVAKGDYICFVDSDDYWNENVLGELMKQIERDNLDVLRFKWQYVNANYVVFNPYKSDPYYGHDFTSEVTDCYTYLNECQGTACYACQFILKTSLVKDVNNGELFTEGILFEDTDWTPRMLLKAARIASTETIVYNYLMRPGSITNALNLTKQKAVLENKMRLVGEMKRQALTIQQSGRMATWFDRMIAATVVSIAGMVATLFWDERKEYVKRLKKLKVLPVYNRFGSKNGRLKINLINANVNLAIWFIHFMNK